MTSPTEGTRRDDLGVGFALGLLSAAALATVGTARAGAAGVSLVWIWLGTWGALGAVLAPLGAAVRRARPLPFQAWCVPVGLMLALAPLAFFARILKATTHHRPLGAVTFAIVSLLVILVAVAFAARLIAELGRNRNSRSFRTVRALSILGAILLAAAGLAVVFRALAGAPELRSLVVDTMLVLAAIAVAGWARAPSGAVERARGLVLLGWAGAVLAAIVALRHPDIAQAIAASAPMVRLLPVPMT